MLNPVETYPFACHTWRKIWRNLQTEEPCTHHCEQPTWYEMQVLQSRQKAFSSSAFPTAQSQNYKYKQLKNNNLQTIIKVILNNWTDFYQTAILLCFFYHFCWILNWTDLYTAETLLGFLNFLKIPLTCRHHISQSSSSLKRIRMSSQWYLSNFLTGQTT